MIEQIEELANSLGITEFDLLVIGDGSGSLVGTPCGWFCVAYDKIRQEVSWHYGGANGGTNNYAELEPGVFALWAYRHVLWANLSKDKQVTPKKIVIISDSEVTVKCGNREFTRRANAPLWASIEWFERKGYVLQWVHVPRNSNKFNSLADKIAGRIRKAIEGVEIDV